MKLCELKIDHRDDRGLLVRILAFAGYKVCIEERGESWRLNNDYFVIVEDDRQEDSQK